MTADVVNLSPYRNPGNGAREALMRYTELPSVRLEGGGDSGLCAVDHLLARLWAEGFKIVPVEEKSDG